jgi:hypothetical protein
MSALEIGLDSDLSNVFHIEQNGLSVGQIELEWTGTQATITLCGTSYDAWWNGILSPTYYLGADGRCVTSARRPTFLHRRFVVQTGAKTYKLAVRNFVGLEFVLTESDVEIGSITRHGTRKMKAEFPDDLLLEVQAFLIWLAMCAAINIE